MYEFNIITTYDDGEQDIYDIEMTPNDVRNEKIFLFTLFRYENNVKSIVKYSICQKVKSLDDFLPFLRERNGKYYFTNEDMLALNIKNKYLELRNCN